MTPSSNAPDLDILVLQCQACYRAWKDADEADLAEAQRLQYGTHIEQLWNILHPSLLRVAHQWMDSNIEPDPETLVMNMFADIVDVLPRLDIDPTQNIHNFLIRIAKYRLIDTWRKLSKQPRRQSKKHASDDPPEPGSADARMWHLASNTSDMGYSSDPYQKEVIDPKSQEDEERVLSRIDEQLIFKALREYWPRTLSREDRQIMHLRYLAEPQLTFGQIAQELGRGWTEEAVRQRHFRILKATRKYLSEQGLI